MLAFALRLVPRCRANLAPQAVFHNSSAAVSVPFRRLPTLARYGEPLLSLHWFDRASTFGLGTVKLCPAHVPYTLLSCPKPSAFHSHVSTCQPTIGASFQPTALNRPRTPRANFTLAHKSVLVKFSFSRTQRRALNRAARASSHAVRFTSERRKWFLPCSVHSLLVPRRRVHLAPQMVCLFSFPSPAASASLEGFQPKRGVGHSHRTTLPTISNRTAKRNMVGNVHNPQSDTVPLRQAFSLRYRVSACRRSDVPLTSTHKHFAALAPNRTSQPTPTRPALLAIRPRQPPTAHP